MIGEVYGGTQKMRQKICIRISFSQSTYELTKCHITCPIDRGHGYTSL